MASTATTNLGNLILDILLSKEVTAFFVYESLNKHRYTANVDEVAKTITELLAKGLIRATKVTVVPQIVAQPWPEYFSVCFTKV